MTVFFDRIRKKWKYDFWRNSVRYVGDCCDSGGKRVKSKRDAVEAEKVEQRRVAVAPKLARATALTLAAGRTDARLGAAISLEEALAWRPLHRPKGAWTRAMREIEEKFGRRWRWHDIRAAFITHVARTSGQLAAQAVARHSDYSTTKAYVEVADE